MTLAGVLDRTGLATRPRPTRQRDEPTVDAIALFRADGVDDLYQRLLAGSARGDDAVASVFAAIILTEAIVALPVATLLAGEGLIAVPETITVVLDADGWPVETTIGAARACRDAAAVGATIRCVLEPVIDELAARGRRGRRGLRLLVADRIAYSAGDQPVASHVPAATAESTIQAVIAGAKPWLPDPPPYRDYHHDRGTFRAAVFRHCCLGYRVSPAGGCCPICPRLRPDRHPPLVRDWLDALSTSDLPRGLHPTTKEPPCP